MRVAPPVGMRIPRLNFPSPARLHKDDHTVDDAVLRVLPVTVQGLRVLHC